MNQRERLRYLADYFKNESDEHRNITVPEDQEGQRRLLRSLMNVRKPGKIEVKPLNIQDAYLSERIRENGIVSGEEIPVYKDKISVWQGDITRLEVDAIVNAANSQMLGCFVPMHSCIGNATPNSITQVYNKSLARCS